MFKNYKEIDLEWLKKNNERIYYFGLGFIQVKINDKYRLHFYTDKLPTITDNPHNHRYDFHSFILKGEIKNIMYKVRKGSRYILENESCNESIKAPLESKEVDIVEDGYEIYKKGDSYFMNYKDFHVVESNNCITLLKRSDYKQEYAQVINKKEENSTCPFSIKEDDDVLWNIIGDMLND